jgi:hypothetical protein
MQTKVFVQKLHDLSVSQNDTAVRNVTTASVVVSPFHIVASETPETTDTKLSDGAIAGIVIAAVVVALFVAYLIYARSRGKSLRVAIYLPDNTGNGDHEQHNHQMAIEIHDEANIKAV